MINDKVVRCVAVALSLMLVLVAGCKKSDLDSGSGSPPEEAAVEEAGRGSKAEIPTGWSLEKALPVVQSDTGEKIGYNCFIYSAGRWGGTREVAVSIPELGIKKINAREVEVLASSERLANEILSNAFVGPPGVTIDERQHLQVKGCRPVIAPSSADASGRPLSEYSTINDGLEVVYQYYAAKGGAIPHEEIANEFFKDYQSETDAFKKRDLLAELTSRIDSEVDKASKNPYLHFTASATLGQFDFNKGEYSLDPVVGPNVLISFSRGFDVRFRADSKFLSLKPAGEDAARKMESEFASNSRAVTSEIYGKVIRADEINNRRYVLVDVTRLEVRRRGAAATDEPLFVE